MANVYRIPGKNVLRLESRILRVQVLPQLIALFLLELAIGFLAGFYYAFHPFFSPFHTLMRKLSFPLLVFVVPVLVGGIVLWQKFILRDLGFVYSGRKGEEEVARLLAELPPDTYVIHDLWIPDVGQIDHIVLSPRGIFVIETKNHRGRVTYDNGRLLLNGKPLRKNPLDQVKATSAALSHLIHREIGIREFVKPVLCFNRAFVEVQGYTQNVWVTSGKGLIPYLLSFPERLPQSALTKVLSLLLRWDQPEKNHETAADSTV